MGYLGSFILDTDVTLTVVWTPLPGDTVTGSNVQVVHEDGTTITAGGTAAGANTFKARFIPDRGGNWTAYWTTIPVGGSTEDRFYVEP